MTLPRNLAIGQVVTGLPDGRKWDLNGLRITRHGGFSAEKMGGILWLEIRGNQVRLR